jgi:FHA domain-containing protein
VINEPYRAPAAVSEIPENWWEEGDGAPGPTPPAGRPHTAPTPDRSGAGAPPPIPAPFVAPRTPAATGLSAAPPEGQVRGARGLEAFFGAAGIAPTVPASMSEEELFALAGAMIREFVSGTMELLRARASIKQEARLEMTALRPTENNPLKFAVTAEEALERLLTPQAMKGYLEPRRAVHEAMQDLRAHELAVLAGMEAAVRGMFERFDPERLERDFSEQSLLASILPAHRKAKCWDLFTQRFRQIGEEAREDFNALFGRAFARAYQEQVERLRSAGPR